MLNKKVGLRLYQHLLSFAEKIDVKYIILDTPSVAKASHMFYKKAGFIKVDKSKLPIEYDYPDRNSILFMKEI